MVFVKPKTRAPENGTRETRWIRTKHIWSEKRKSQLMADWTQLTAVSPNPIDQIWTDFEEKKFRRKALFFW